MKSVLLSGSPRTSVGKKDARALRIEQKVPCVLYGGKEQIHFSAAEADFKQLVFTAAVQTVELDLGNEKYNAILQDIQFHPISDRILHVDFLQIQEDKPVTIAVPIEVEGVAPGVREGGKLIVKQRKLRVKGMLKDLPDTVKIDISNLAIGQSVRVSELSSDVISFLDSPKAEIVAVSATRASRQAEEDAKK